MHIAIANRLKPFSHMPGILCALPGTVVQMRVFPTQVVWGAEEKVCFGLHGPVQGFTVEQDLERSCLRVFGRAQEGFFTYSIGAGADGIELYLERGPPAGMILEGVYGRHFCRKKERVLLSQTPLLVLPVPEERLSLGAHKAQEWEMVLRRLDLREIFPLWLRLGQMTPHERWGTGGVASLLHRIPSHLAALDKHALEEDFLLLVRTGFHGLLATRLNDAQHQGIIQTDVAIGSCSSVLLSQGAAFIRRLFFLEEDGRIFLLPALLPGFDCGRFIHIRSKGGDSIDMEWSKWQLRRVVYRSQSTQHIDLVLPKDIRSFRLRYHLKDKGVRISRGTPLFASASQVLLLDRFEK